MSDVDRLVMLEDAKRIAKEAVNAVASLSDEQYEMLLKEDPADAIAELANQFLYDAGLATAAVVDAMLEEENGNE